jgi:predicted PurR-regulated permease PerM
MSDRNAPPLLTYEIRGRNWLQRAALAVVGAAFIVVGFFFLTAVLIAGALLAAVVAVRFWWVIRRLRKAREAAGPLEGDYTVVDSARLPHR